YTAAETGFRLMTQAAGRAGRRDDRGRVFIQTYQPEHYAVKHAANQDYQGFFAEEILMRQMMGHPPFSGFFSILVTSEEKVEAEVASQKLAAEIAKEDGEGIAMILGPVPAALPRFRGEYRYQLIVKATKEEPLRELVLPVVEKLKKDRKSNVKYQLSLNPTNIV
ncbi:MAG: primosomal protein N', partial [Anaerotignum sp.]|nr:primosomal protein N' [Anaerotignum sp.]